MSTAYLGLGSNVDAESNIRSGIAELREIFSRLEISPVYRSEAVGFTGNPFTNLVASVQTELQPLELKEYLNELEDRYGRVRNIPKFSDRTLDIDILLYDDLRLICPRLELPRPEVLHFAHVLKPLADLAPGLLHPVNGTSMASIWQGFPDKPAGIEVIRFTF
jgi:2-amino-4-hydroxy-6-hydroxymethyldihydropteridine diphosphokinase